MRRRQFIPTAVAGLFAIFCVATSAQPVSATALNRQKLVIQVSDAEPAKWNLALNNAKNVQEELGASQVDIEIVAYGPGIGMLKLDSVSGVRVADAIKAGVRILACENTLRNQKLSHDEMLPAIGYVNAGVTQLMKRQAEGWAYIRP